MVYLLCKPGSNAFLNKSACILAIIPRLTTSYRLHNKFSQLKNGKTISFSISGILMKLFNLECADAVPTI